MVTYTCQWPPILWLYEIIRTSEGITSVHAAFKKMVNISLLWIAYKWAALYSKWEMTGSYRTVKWFTCSTAHSLRCSVGLSWLRAHGFPLATHQLVEEEEDRETGLNLAVFNRRATPILMPLRSIFHRGMIIKTWVSECQTLDELSDCMPLENRGGENSDGLRINAKWRGTFSGEWHRAYHINHT